MLSHSTRRIFTIAQAAATAALFINFCPSLVLADPSPAGAPPPIAAAAPSGPRLHYRIAVDQWKVDQTQSEWYAIPQDVRDGIQSQLIDNLQKSGYFMVQEREQGAMDQMSEEDRIAAAKAGSMPATAAPLPARQQRTAADYVITPSVIGFSMTNGKSGAVSIGGFNFGANKVKATLTINVRISDAQTSDIVDSETSEGTCEAKSKSTDIAIGSTGYSAADFDSSPAGTATQIALQDAVHKIVACITQRPWTAKVAAQDPTTGRVIVNAGVLAGVQIGDVFDIYHPGGVVTDPDTGEVISQGDEVKVGTIKIMRVEQNASFGDIVAGHGFKVHDIVQVVQ